MTGTTTRVRLIVATLLLGTPLLLVSAAVPDWGMALTAFWRGSFGTEYAIASATLVRAIPLALAGLGVALAFRAGVLNIGAEGQLLAGAAASALAVQMSAPAMGGAVPIVALVAGAAAGAAWSGVAAILRARFGVLEVISTIMLNFVALHLVGYLVRGPLQEPTHAFPQSVTIPDLARLPRLLAAHRLHAGALLALVAAFALWWWLRATAGGFRVRVAGANPDAARSAGGIDVLRTTTRAFLVSGALAGFAGASELLGVTYALYENLSPGYGYTAVAVALLARLHPLGVILSATLFGALEAGALAMQRDAAVPSVVVYAIEATLVIAVVIGARLRLDVLTRDGRGGRGRHDAASTPRGPAAHADANGALPA